MYKIFTTLFACVLVVTTSFSQLVINEIMYNPPEAGDDSLEYVEIINTSAAAINLSGFKLADGVSGNFPSINLGAGQILLMAKDSVAIQIVFGKSSFQWSTGSLNNTGETITIRNSNNDIIDEVAFAEIEPWPAGLADGTGASLELCDPSLNNNDGSHWRASEKALGISINGVELKASPGVANGLTCTFTPDANVEVKNFSFTPKDITINVGDLVRWTAVNGHHNVNGKQSTFPNNPESFGSGDPASAPWTYDFTFNKAGKYNYRCDPHAGSGMVGTVTVQEVMVTIPKYPITLVTTVNNEGVADSLGVICEIEGTVYGINQRPNGLQFTLIDNNNNGIGIFNNTGNFGYIVTEGDKISVKGKIEQFNGLTQMVPTEISVQSQNNTLVLPKEISLFQENDESSLVVLNNLNYVDAAQWKGDGTSFNVNFTDGNNNYVIRIDNDCELSSMSAPTAPLKIIGLLGQFDNATPFTEGYQLLPRYAVDMITTSSTEDGELAARVSAYPNPFTAQIHLTSDFNIQNVKVYNSEGMLVVECNHHIIDMSHFDKGMYILQVMTNKGIVGIKAIRL